jgi:hypothetical protein
VPESAPFRTSTISCLTAGLPPAADSSLPDQFRCPTGVYVMDIFEQRFWRSMKTSALAADIRGRRCKGYMAIHRGGGGGRRVLCQEQSDPSGESSSQDDGIGPWSFNSDHLFGGHLGVLN